MNDSSKYPDSDKELLRRSAESSDTAAFSCLVKRYQARVIGYSARFLGGDLDSGADIAQETFLRLWENRYTYRPLATLPAYLLRIAHNLCVSRLRSEKHSSATLDDYETVADSSAPIDLPLAVRDALMALPPDLRAVFLLHEYEGLTYREISDTFDIALGTVASRKSAAVQALRKSLAPWMGTGHGETK